MEPREKYLLRGIESLSDLELTAILISSGIQGLNYRKIASHLLQLLQREQKNGGANLEKVASVKGIGQVKAMQVLAGIELGKRLHSLYESQQIRISSTRDAISQFDEIRSRKRECLKAIYLNARFELIHSEIVGVGNIDSISIAPRDLLLPALEKNALYIVIAHNHPSGSLEPSRQDIEMTERIQRSAKDLGFVLLDHIIVSSKGWRRVRAG